MEMEKDIQVNNAIKNALLDLEKAETLLIHWTNEYLFEKNPNPKQAPGERIPLTDLERTQSAKWFNEYRFISRFVQMAQDYVTHGKQELEQALQNKSEYTSMGAGE